MATGDTSETQHGDGLTGRQLAVRLGAGLSLGLAAGLLLTRKPAAALGILAAGVAGSFAGCRLAGWRRSDSDREVGGAESRENGAAASALPHSVATAMPSADSQQAGYSADELGIAQDDSAGLTERMREAEPALPGNSTALAELPMLPDDQPSALKSDEPPQVDLSSLSFPAFSELENEVPSPPAASPSSPGKAIIRVMPRTDGSAVAVVHKPAAKPLEVKPVSEAVEARAIVAAKPVPVELSKPPDSSPRSLHAAMPPQPSEQARRPWYAWWK